MVFCYNNPVLTEEYPRKPSRSEEHTSELQSRQYLVCRLLLEKKKKHDDHNQVVTNAVDRACTQIRVILVNPCRLLPNRHPRTATTGPLSNAQQTESARSVSSA